MRKIKIGDKVICLNNLKLNKKDFIIYGAGWKEKKIFIVNKISKNTWDEKGDIYWEKNNATGIFGQGLKLFGELTQSQRLNCQK